MLVPRTHSAAGKVLCYCAVKSGKKARNQTGHKTQRVSLQSWRVSSLISRPTYRTLCRLTGTLIDEVITLRLEVGTWGEVGSVLTAFKCTIKYTALIFGRKRSNNVYLILGAMAVVFGLYLFV